MNAGMNTSATALLSTVPLLVRLREKHALRCCEKTKRRQRRIAGPLSKVAIRGPGAET
jgi:hypothetical protein